MGLIQCKPSKNIHIDNPPKYEEKPPKYEETSPSNNNPYNLNKTITAAYASAELKKQHDKRDKEDEEKYKSTIKYHLEVIYNNIQDAINKGYSSVNHCMGPSAVREFNSNYNAPITLNLYCKRKESTLYEKMCDEICDILNKDGFTVKLKKASCYYVYGIPGHPIHNMLDINWYKN